MNEEIYKNFLKKRDCQKGNHSERFNQCSQALTGSSK